MTHDELNAYLASANGEEAVKLLASIYAVSDNMSASFEVLERNLLSLDRVKLAVIRKTLEPLQKLRDTVRDTGLRARNATPDEVTEYAEKHAAKLAEKFDVYEQRKQCIRNAAKVNRRHTGTVENWLKAELEMVEKLAPAASDTRASPEAADRIEALEAAIKKAAGWFDDYADQHRDKSASALSASEVTSRNDKARRNQERAAELRATLGDKP